MTPGILYPVQSAITPQLGLPLAVTCAACGAESRPMVDAFTGGLVDVCSARSCGHVRRVPRVHAPPEPPILVVKPKCPHCRRLRATCYQRPCATRAEAKRMAAHERERERARKRQESVYAARRATREANRERRLNRLRAYWQERGTLTALGAIA